MNTRLTMMALACLTMGGASAAAELAPGAGHSIKLAQFTGTLYYTVEKAGYKVVATLASGAGDLPIRFESTLAPGQGVVISVPQAAGQPSLDFEIVRQGDALFVRDVEFSAEESAWMASRK